MTDEKTSDILCESKLMLLDLLEELGQAAALLRESYSDCENGNITGAEIVASDVVSIMATIEAKSSEIGASIAKWIDA